jgi:dolichol kinase
MLESAKQPGTGGYTSNVDHDFRIEIIRKLIHLCSLSIPIVYWFVSKQTAITILVPLTAAFLIVDLARHYHRQTGRWFYKVFGWLLRKKEQDERTKRLNGATYVVIAALVCVLLFPKVIVVTSFAILILGDSTAALVGKRFGTHRFFGKTFEGSLAFFVSGLVVVALAPKVEYVFSEYLIGAIGAAVGAAVELLAIHIDDNLLIPVSVGGVMWLLYALMLPTIDLATICFVA